MSNNLPDDEALYGYPSYGDTSWLELRQLAKRAGVSTEHLCQTVENATHFARTGKAIDAPEDDLEAVIRTLSADPDFTNFDLETKVEWRESDHPRDESGRFKNGSNLFPIERQPTQFEKQQIRDDVVGLKAGLSKIFVGMESRWKGQVRLRHYLTFKYLGTKDWECTISMAYELVTYPAYKISTLIHELVHSFSPTTKEQYIESPGWEEAVVENITQLYQERLAKEIGLSIPTKDFAERNSKQGYADLSFGLKRLQEGLKKDPYVFYDEILRKPATERIEYIKQEAAKLPASEQARFAKLFDIYTPRLNDYVIPNPHAPENSEKKSDSMNQDKVIEIILSARTREEVIHAKEVMVNWMRLHPGDLKVASSGEMLALLEQAHGIKDPDLDLGQMTIIDCNTGEITEIAGTQNKPKAQNT